jgi:hypothetical protein
MKKEFFKKDSRGIKLKGRIILLPLLVTMALHAQRVILEAPEKWSMPIRVDEINDGFSIDPSITPDGMTIYLNYGTHKINQSGISVSKKINGSWIEPVLLNGNVNIGYVSKPSISPDGKRLYMHNWGGFGGWDLWYCDWDTATNDWGKMMNVGGYVNTEYYEWACMTPDNRHLYYTNERGSPFVSSWIESIKMWGPGKPIDDEQFLYGPDDVAVTKSLRKIYTSGFSGYHDIYVNYYDTLTQRWSEPMFLNFCALLDQEPGAKGVRQFSPTLTGDGKTMYFETNHDSVEEIWMTTMLIDENGNPVHAALSKPENVPEGYSLEQNFPNPFNPATTIRYDLRSDVIARVEVFNTVGAAVKILECGRKSPGRYRVVWDGADERGNPVCSGVYFYRLTAGETSITRKMVLVR